MDVVAHGCAPSSWERLCQVTDPAQVPVPSTSGDGPTPTSAQHARCIVTTAEAEHLRAAPHLPPAARCDRLGTTHAGLPAATA
ncbi:MAG: hypothetical protein M3Z04_10885 [Chloroflexota bacterium]|nr:hypothetical protein [Chloroflexota bacterium]